MPNRRKILLVLSVFAFFVTLSGMNALAATPSFTITASNVTMSAAGFNSVTFTLTSVDGYSGTINVICDPTKEPVGATLPLCGQPSPIADPDVLTLAADGTVQGSFPLLTTFPPPCSGACPIRLDRPRRRFASGLALAGALLVGLSLGFRRRVARWFVLMLLIFGTLAGLSGISACGGTGGGTLTPGVWPYVVEAVGQDAASASVTINVTVPPGIRWTD
jgi:hypothetical protein